MRWAALVVLAGLALAGCRSADTPLAHALLAVKAGDREAFTRAKTEADAALAAAWQPGGDPCQIIAPDFQKRGEAILIENLDHADLFKLAEEDRFVYAAHIAGRFDAAMVEAWNSNAMAPIVNPDFAHISQMTEKMQACQAHGNSPISGATAFSSDVPGEAERVQVLRDWQAELQSRYGNDLAYQDAMHRAVAQLDSNGFTAEWPTTLQYDDSEPGSTYAGVRRREKPGR